MENVWGVSGNGYKGTRKVFGRCLKGVKKVSGGCVKGVGSVHEDVWKVC